MKLYQQLTDDLTLLIQGAFIGAHQDALAGIVRSRR
jgi:hypothetical protein